MSRETVHSRSCETFFRHSAVLSLPAVILRKVSIVTSGPADWNRWFSGLNMCRSIVDFPPRHFSLFAAFPPHLAAIIRRPKSDCQRGSDSFSVFEGTIKQCDTIALARGRAPRYCHISPLMRDLHYLPIRQRIHFKVLLFISKPIHGIALFTSKTLPSWNRKVRKACVQLAAPSIMTQVNCMGWQIIPDCRPKTMEFAAPRNSTHHQRWCF